MQDFYPYGPPLDQIGPAYPDFPAPDNYHRINSRKKPSLAKKSLKARLGSLDEYGARERAVDVLPYPNKGLDYNANDEPTYVKWPNNYERMANIRFNREAQIGRSYGNRKSEPYEYNPREDAKLPKIVYENSYSPIQRTGKNRQAMAGYRIHEEHMPAYNNYQVRNRYAEEPKQRKKKVRYQDRRNPPMHEPDVIREINEQDNKKAGRKGKKLALKTMICRMCGLTIPEVDYELHSKSHQESVCLQSLDSIQNQEMPANKEELVRFKYSARTVPETCQICIDDFKQGIMVVCLPCLHKFHEKCILDWIDKASTCPSCQRTMFKA